MWQPHLNMSKTRIRNARCTIPSPNRPHHLPSKHLPLLEWESAVCLWRNSCFSWALQMAWFSILTTRAIMAEITISSKVYHNSSIPCNFCKSSRITTHSLNIFHAQLHHDSHIMRPHPNKTALHMPPHGTCMKLISEHAIFHLISKPLHTAIWNPTIHSPPKLFQHCCFADIFRPCICHGKFVAPLQPQFHFFHVPLLVVL